MTMHKYALHVARSIRNFFSLNKAIFKYTNIYIKTLTNSLTYQTTQHYLFNVKPHITLSVILHITLILLLLTNISKFPTFKGIQNNDGQIIITDLVSVGKTTNIKITSEEGKKGYSKDLEPHKQKNTRNKNSGDGEKIPIHRDSNRIKKKPIESKAFKEEGNLNKLQTGFKEITQEGKEGNVSNKTEKGSIGKGNSVYNKLKPNTIAIQDSIRSQFIDCWNVPYGALNTDKIQVQVNIELDTNGKVLAANIINLREYNKDPFFRAMADSALRAVHSCSPLQGLPKEKYGLWKKMELIFDPRGMI